MNSSPQGKSSNPGRTVQIFSRRPAIAAALIVAFAATAITAISISSAQSKKPDQFKVQLNQTTAFVPNEAGKDRAESSEFAAAFQGQSRQVPVLTMQNAPNIPQCRQILNQDMLDLANNSVEDPGVTFEQNRRAHPHMIEMPPPVDCASGLWKAARRGGVAEPLIDADLINSRQFARDTVYNYGALSALIGTNVNLSNGVEGYQGENSVAIDPNNPQHIIAHSNTFFRDTTPQCQSPTGGAALTFGTMALFGSSDGGQTWKYNCAPWHTSVTGGVASANAYFGSDPALAWDASGNAYACYMLLSQNASGSAGASIVVAKSTDVGQTWSQLGTPVVNRIGVTTNLDDKEMFAIDTTSGQPHSFPNRLYVIWDEGNVERIAHSDDGVTWTTVQPASNTGAIGGNLVVGADGTVYAIWTRYNVETIVFSKSIDGGTTWTAPAVIATLALQSFGSNNLPPAQDQRGINGFGAIDVDKNPNSAFFGNLYVSFPDFPSGTTSGADLNTYIVRSTNGGTSWGTRVKVNDDNFGASQFFPWLAVDQSDGTVNVSWLDSRIDPLNRKTQAVYARSSDGGVSFEPNIPVTDNGSGFRNNVNYADENSTDNTTFNGNQYGDYSGIAAFNRQVHPLWTDSRMFFPTADTQSPTRREDNATSTIVNCSAPGTVAAPTVNSSTAPSVSVSWTAPAGWGTNATNGTYSVYRNTSATFPGGSPLASGLTATSYVDTTGVNGTTYFYFVRARNNCPGTALTPMTSDSAASASVVYGSAGTGAGTLQGTVTSGGSPVSGVVVSAGTYSASTNASGFYQIVGITAGSYTVSASPAGYNPASVNGVLVNDGATTVQNLSLSAIASNNCFTDTAFGDFSAGSGAGVDIASSPGDVQLAGLGAEAADQVSSPASLAIGTTVSSTTWAGQTFRAGATGNLTKISVGLGLNSGTTGTVTVEIRNLNGANPGTTILASGTLGPVTNVGSAALYTTSFASPAAVVSGTSYSVVVKGVSGSVFVVRGSTAGGSTLANGQYFSSTNSGGAWTGVAADMYFTEYVKPVGLQTSGNFVSAVKDSSAVVGATPNWTTLTWNNAALPGGSTLKFQVAASNSSSGPFTFVGPDGTAGTFFNSSGASLSQFNGSRYLKYKALFTGNGSTTPTLNDVTVCFNNVTQVSTTLTAAPATGTFGGTVDLSATLTDGTNGISGKSISFTLNGNSVGSANTNGSGVATLSNVSLAGINAGSYPTGVGASFAGDSSYTAGNSTAALTVNKADQTITFNPLADKTYGDADFGVSATASSGLAVSFGASGNCTVTSGTVHITGAGSCTITASQAGDTNYNAAPDVPRSFNIAKANQTISFGALGDKTYGDADFQVSASASSGLTVSFGASGNCTVTGDMVHLTGAGSCTITASQSGDANYNAASDVAHSFNIAKATATVTLSNLSQTYDGNPKSASATTNPAGLNVTFGYALLSPNKVKIAGGNPTNAGSYTVTATIDDPNYQGSATDTLVIARANATINVSGFTGTYDGNSHGATGTATGAQGEDLSSLFDFGSSYTNVPGGTANWTFNAADANTNYNQTNGSVAITINKATPVITWSNPADLIYGTALSGTQLNATAGVPGSFGYTPASGTVLSYGSHNLHVDFTPTDTTNYNNAQKDVSINILSAILSTTMTVDRNPALVGYNHNYLISITNNGNTAATSMTLSDPLPPASLVRFTAVTSSQGSCSYDTGTNTVNCSIGTLGIGATANIQITVKSLQAGTLNNTATVNASHWDPATVGNTASVNGLQAIAQVDLSVSKVDSADPIFVSQTTTYTMVVKNYNTPISATGVVLTDNLPASMQFVSATTSQGSLVTPPVGSTGIVTANIGTLAVNGIATITVTVRATQAGTITNTASATANENESNPANNSASQPTTVNDAALQKVLLAKQVLTGGCENTTGNVYLTGPAPTGGLTINLSTTNLAGVTVPASVFIPAGQTVSPAFNVTTTPVATKQVGLVNATLGASTVSRGLTINVGSGVCPP